MTLARVFVLALAFLLAACADGPRAIEIGAEECAHCRMRVSEEHFASQLRTQQGRVYVFDSIECMAEFVHDADANNIDVRGMWVTDFTQAGSWLEVDEAHFLQSRELRSPMGMNLSAYATESAARTHQDEHGGDVLDWNGVLTLVSEVTVVGGRPDAH